MATNPNEPNYPYSGGTDNPGDDTSIPGGPSNVAAVETGLPTGRFLAPSHPPVVAGIAQSGTDTNLGAFQAIPPSGGSFEAPDDTELATDTGGPTVDPITGDVREPGQDEVAGETETTRGAAPLAFPEPTP